MPGRSYADFDLLIERSGEGYRARVQRSPGGEGEHEFRLPFSEAQIRKLLPRLAWPRRGRNLRRPGSARTEDVEHFGAQLFRAVFAGDVEACLRRSLRETDDTGRGLRLRLRLNGVPDLARLPWEYLYDAHRDYLSLAEETPIVRYLELPRLANPAGTNPLDVEEEWRQIQAALADLSSRGLLVLGTEIRFVLIPKGSFVMGSTKKDEKPSHPVTITKPFCLGQSEVTWRQWSQVMGGKPNPPQQASDDLPATKVSWDQAQLFVSKLNEVAGRPRFRLPSEAEWEYAARATTITSYSFGNETARQCLGMGRGLVRRLLGGPRRRSHGASRGQQAGPAWG